MDGPPGTADLAPAWAAALVERLAAVENELRATRETVERLSERLTPEPIWRVPVFTVVAPV